MTTQVSDTTSKRRVLFWTHPQPTFPRFSLALQIDPSTRRIWYALATAHDLETHEYDGLENPPCLR